MKIVVQLDSRANKDGLHNVIIMVTFSRTVKRTLNTGLKTEKRYFDKRSGEINNDPMGSSIIWTQKNKIETWRKTEMLNNRRLTVESFDAWLNRGGAGETFNSFYQERLSNDSTLAYVSERDQQQTLNLLNEFRPRIMFTQLNKRFVIDWNNFLAKEGYSTNTIKKHHKNVKKFVNLAIDHGKLEVTLDQHPYRSFRSPTKESDRTFLTVEEMHTIAAGDFGAANPTRDLFLFACNTGLRFSDTQSEISYTDIGIEYRPIKTQRTTGLVRVPYDVMIQPDHVRKFATKPLPQISNVSANRDLKNIMVDTDIEKLLTFHVARHTFLTNVARITGNLFKVMKYGGLKKTDTAMVYVHLAGV